MALQTYRWFITCCAYSLRLLQMWTGLDHELQRCCAMGPHREGEGDDEPEEDSSDEEQPTGNGGQGNSSRANGVGGTPLAGLATGGGSGATRASRPPQRQPLPDSHSAPYLAGLLGLANG